MGYSRKNPHPPMEGILKILMGGGLTALEIQTGGGL